MRTLNVRVTLLALLAVTGCGHGRTFTWIGEVPRQWLEGDGAFRISAGDVIGIRIWNQDANSVDRARVRDDGKITIPFLNDVVVAGMEPPELARSLEVKLRTFIMNPAVTVVVHEQRPLRVSVVGKAARPGIYDLDPGAGVLIAIAAAGGRTTYASDDGVFVLRRGASTEGRREPGRIRFRYDDLAAGNAPAALFRLRPGDVVVLE